MISGPIRCRILNVWRRVVSISTENERDRQNCSLCPEWPGQENPATALCARLPAPQTRLDVVPLSRPTAWGPATQGKIKKRIACLAPETEGEKRGHAQAKELKILPQPSMTAKTTGKAVENRRIAELNSRVIEIHRATKDYVLGSRLLDADWISSIRKWTFPRAMLVGMKHKSEHDQPRVPSLNQLEAMQGLQQPQQSCSPDRQSRCGPCRDQQVMNNWSEFLPSSPLEAQSLRDNQ